MNKDTFIWKRKEQPYYYKKAFLDYFVGLCKYARDNNYVLYFVDDDELEFKLMKKYFERKEPVNVQDFYKKKDFECRPLDLGDHSSVAFTIEFIEEDPGESGCGQCGMRYGGGPCFSGFLYNGCRKPIRYNGRLKTWDFFTCNCGHQYDGEDDVCYIEREYTEEETIFYVTCLCINNMNNWIERASLFGMYCSEIVDFPEYYSSDETD